MHIEQNMKILNPIKVNNDLLKLLCSVLPDSTYHQFWYNSFLFSFFFVCLLLSKSRHERARNERFYVRSWTSMNLIFCGLFRRTKGGIIIDTLCRTIYSKKRPCEKEPLNSTLLACTRINMIINTCVRRDFWHDVPYNKSFIGERIYLSLKSVS